MKSPLKCNEADGCLPLVSVIIPVWNGAAHLTGCLTALKQQTYPSSRIEVIVVDNGSSDGSVEIAASFPRVTILHKQRPGSYAARNAGLAQAQGKFVMFLDADCRPDSDWIRNGIAAASAESNLGVLAGKIEVESARSTAASLYERIFSFDQEENVRRGVSVAANWLSPKAVLDRFGGFDACLKSGGDTQLSRVIQDAGYAVVYCETVTVYHPARQDLSALVAKRRRIVGGKWIATSSRHKLLWLTALVSWDATRRMARVLKADLKWADRVKVLGIIAALWAVGVAELTRVALGFEPRRQ